VKSAVFADQVLQNFDDDNVLDDVSKTSGMKRVAITQQGFVQKAGVTG
jgi:hypothetical protein